MSRHTPGPWVVLGDGETHQLCVYRADYEGGVIADIQCHLEDDENPDNQRTANASLIAAAPDYADAAECYVRWTEAFKDEIPENFCRAMEAAFGAKLRAAIAKATLDKCTQA